MLRNTIDIVLCALLIISAIKSVVRMRVVAKIDDGDTVAAACGQKGINKFLSSGLGIIHTGVRKPITIVHRIRVVDNEDNILCIGRRGRRILCRNGQGDVPGIDHTFDRCGGLINGDFTGSAGGTGLRRWVCIHSERCGGNQRQRHEQAQYQADHSFLHTCSPFVLRFLRSCIPQLYNSILYSVREVKAEKVTKWTKNRPNVQY
jgi:hypothetical protein